jgi:hypothetical protein
LQPGLSFFSNAREREIQDLEEPKKKNRRADVLVSRI